MFLCCFMKVLNECCKDRKYNKNYKITESCLCCCYLHPRLLLLGDQQCCHHLCHHHCHHHDHRVHPLQHPHCQRRDVRIKGTFCLSLRGLGLLSIAHNHHRRHNQANLNQNFIVKKNPRWMIHRRLNTGWIRLRLDL